MFGTILSPNCKIELEGEASSLLVEFFHQQAVHYTLMASLAAVIEIIWLIKQMSYTSTPSVCCLARKKSILFNCFCFVVDDSLFSY
jgi:hypothetical protein